MLSCFSCVQLCAILWAIVCQAPLSIDFFRQEYWHGLPCPPPGYLLNPGIKPASLTSSAWAGGLFCVCVCVFTTGSTGKLYIHHSGS